MRSENHSVPANATEKAQRLLKDANVVANSSKKLIHRVRSKLQSPRSDVTIATVIDHVDSIDARPLDVLQALLQVLESQVSAEKFQAAQHRLLVSAARRGHHEILDYLHTRSTNTDFSFGEALETAILHNKVTCVEVLLKRSPSIHNVERALLTTDYIELRQAREIIRLLLEPKLPHSVLEYLLLKMYVAVGDDHDDKILDMLLKATCQESQQLVTVSEADCAGLYAYFEIQKQFRLVSTHKRISSTSSKTSTTSVQATELRRRCRNVFGDDDIRSPDNVILKLLARYFNNCATKKLNRFLWSLDTVNLILEKLPQGTEKLPEYAQCLFLAASCQQTDVFTLLLRHRPLPLEVLRSLDFREIVKNVDMTIALVNCLNEHHTDHKYYLEGLQLLLLHACEAYHIPSAVQICSRSRIPLSISPVRKYLKTALEYESSMESVKGLLKLAQTEESDLEAFWEYVIASIDFPTELARVLLQAGCKGLIVARTFLRCVQFNEEVSNLTMILEEWKVNKLIALRERFDYITKGTGRPCQSGLSNTQSHYFSTLAAAMSVAIDRQQHDLCQLLLAKGTPLILDGESLLEKAVRRGDLQSPLEQDKVLKMILDSEKQYTGAQVVLDYALLQAIKYKRSQLVADLTNLGASTLAYKYESWRTVFQSKDETILSSLLAIPRSALELSKNFMAIFASFAIDPKIWITLCEQLHAAGYVNSKCYSWVLSVLCLCKKATVTSAEQLLRFGASTRNELDQCIEQCWLHGDLSVFKVLIGNGISQLAAESLFQLITRDVMNSTNLPIPAGEEVAQTPKSTIALDAMNLLLQQNISKRLKDTALCSVAVSYRKSASQRTLVLKTLLEKGARFSEDDGLALLHCLLIDNKGLMSQISASRPPLKARQSAIQFAVHFPNDMGDPAPSQRFHALAQLLYPLPSTVSIVLSDQNVMDITGVFLSPSSDTPTTLIHHFYGWLRNRAPSGLSDLEHCWTVEKKLNTIFEGLAQSKDHQIQLVERITAVLAWTRPEPDSAIASARYFNRFWLPRKSMSRYLIEASKAGLTPVVGALLEAGISPNVFDESGRSALFWATSKNEPTIVLLLMDTGADLNDGSLHEAMCQQHQAIFKLLVKAGHGRMCVSPLHDDTTPLLAFIQFDHNMSEITKFPVTINLLLSEQRFTPEFCRDLKSAVETAITKQHAFQLILALLPWLRKSFDAQREIYESPIARGPFRYSLLSLVDRWEYTCLNRSQRNSLLLSFQGVGFEEAFYTIQGDQPGNAVNVPEAIVLAEEARKRRVAFETKECCIHGDKAESENEIHAGLMPTCAATHGWKGEIVCTDCLKQYLESRMFPHDDVTIKYKFPATKIPCWAPKCASTELSYNVLREHADPEIFHLYDLALCQALLREGKSVVKCATQDCPGAHWYDEDDVDENLKMFFCEICYQNTCTECNDHYEKHDGHPCPAGEDTRKSERIKEEEKLSEEALKLEKRCPKCQLMYQKYFGCDHIVCGKNVYDNKVDKGCRFEFCDICFGAWPNGHTRRCVHRM